MLNPKTRTQKALLRILSLVVLLYVLAWLVLPSHLSNSDTSTILYSREGKLMGASVAKDQQWRFKPSLETVPEKFAQALIYFEDEYFYYHLGVNPVSLVRAMYQNYQAKRTVSGASTLSMQTIRLQHLNKGRTFWRKLTEMGQAIAMELWYSKEDILQLYAANAPFGGNIVGLEAASWRYFNRSPDKLSWAEAAVLAVLPNAPALMYPGKNEVLLKAKRDKLLRKLNANGIIDQSTLELSLLESIPNRPLTLPQKAPHLIELAKKKGLTGQQIRSTLSYSIQSKNLRTIKNYHEVYSQNDIHHIGVIVVEIATGKILSYVGNSNCSHFQSERYVDVVQAARSTGSILKPLLYQLNLAEGILLPRSLLPDHPVHIAGFSPRNFNRTFSGAVPADKSLQRSLNVPFVLMLQKYGIEKFHHYLKKYGISTMNQPSAHYGLSLILGGAEATLFELAQIYTQYGQVLGEHPMTKIGFLQNESRPAIEHTAPLYERGSIWWTFEAMKSLTRPLEEKGWKSFVSNQEVAWKTGTSFGHRDAWAIGQNGKYLVGVWVGNANGEGRPQLTGLKTAAPLMFSVFGGLPKQKRIGKIPTSDLRPLRVCRKSGLLPNPYCPVVDTLAFPTKGYRADNCSFHQPVFLNKALTHRVNSSCYPIQKMEKKIAFELPPKQDWYYQNKSNRWGKLPLLAGCLSDQNHQTMRFLYPKQNLQIFIPKKVSGKRGKVVLELAHRIPESNIKWYLNHQYIGQTTDTHKMPISPEKGKHRVDVVDDQGERHQLKFEIVYRGNE